MTLLTAGECATLLLELVHAHGREGRSAMVLGSVVVDLVDWDSRVNDVRLDGLCDVVSSCVLAGVTKVTYASEQQAGWSRARGGAHARRRPSAQRC